jgi:hypothetical protein
MVSGFILPHRAPGSGSHLFLSPFITPRTSATSEFLIENLPHVEKGKRKDLGGSGVTSFLFPFSTGRRSTEHSPPRIYPARRKGKRKVGPHVASASSHPRIYHPCRKEKGKM